MVIVSVLLCSEHASHGVIVYVLEVGFYSTVLVHMDQFSVVYWERILYL